MHNNFINSVVKKIFPEGTESTQENRISPSQYKYWVIPGKENEPRWLVPDKPECAWPLLEQWSPYDLPSRIKWKFLKMAYKGKCFSLIPGIIPLWINIPENSSWEYLGWKQVQPPVPVVYIGRSQHPDRKAVLGLVNSDNNEVMSVAKVPLTPSAAQAINYEFSNLEVLESEKPGCAPRAFFSNRDDGIATQEFFSGTPTNRILTKRHLSYLIDLAIPGETTSLRKVVQNLGQEIEKIQDHISPKDRTLLNKTLEEADDSSLLPAVWEHGDFAPWNLKSASNGSLRAVDWETSSRLGIPLFDLVHFHSIQMFHFKEKEVFTNTFKKHVYQYLMQLKIEPNLSRNIIQACLLRDWLRRFNEGSRKRTGFLLRMLSNLPGDLR